MHFRNFVVIGCSLVFANIVFVLPAWSESDDAIRGRAVFDRILKKADSGNWRSLPIGDLMGKIAREFEGIPYRSNTLDSSVDRETPTVNLDGLDCVTFFENVLGFARMLKKGGHSPGDLVKEVIFTRYRSGIVGDYTSRLHYLSDWLYENQSNGVVKIIANLPGAETLRCKIRFMSTHPGSYQQLVRHPELVAKIKEQEIAINKRPMRFVPTSKIAIVESRLQTGDIVAICTTIEGLDVAHTGLIVRTADGVAHFMDASSKFGKVTLESGSVSQALARNKTWTGAIFARPQEP